jgi:c-di-GMP-binding flagellar brake protein YcgR
MTVPSRGPVPDRSAMAEPPEHTPVPPLAIAEADLARYTVRSPIEIGAILRAMVESRALVTVHFDGGRRFLLTALIEADAERGRLLFDTGAEPSANRHLLDSDRALFVGTHDGIRVQFSVAPVQAATWDGAPAFAAPLPSELLKLQRRDSFRIVLGALSKVVCRIPVPGREVDLPVADLSIGGLCAIGELPVAVAIGERYPGVTLAIPDLPALGVELELRGVLPQPSARGSARMRYGFRFRHLPEGGEKAIQRYILRIERERRSRERGGPF